MAPRVLVFILLSALPLTACASIAAGEAPEPESVIDGKAINPRVERLSYVNPRYFGLTEAYAECVDVPSLAAPAMEGCASDEWAIQKERLAKVESALLALAEAYSRHSDADLILSAEQVRRSQASWAQFIADDCSLRARRAGSTWGPALASECDAVSTAYRAQQLEDLLLSARGELERSFGKVESGGNR
jgi:uncharacterized protein YecT (DUF1311 family)